MKPTIAQVKNLKPGTFIRALSNDGTIRIGFIVKQNRAPRKNDDLTVIFPGLRNHSEEWVQFGDVYAVLENGVKPKVRKKRAPAEKYDGPWASFSVHKATEGGISFTTAKELLEYAGVKPVRRGHSPYVGQYGLQVPDKFRSKAEGVLFP